MFDIRLDDEDIEQLQEAIAAGLEASPKSSAKWSILYEWLTDHFGVDESDVRASMLAERGNITNRVHKDNAWENPKILALIIHPDGDVRLATLRDQVRVYLKAFGDRLETTSKLRVVLYFEGTELAAVEKFRFEPFLEQEKLVESTHAG